MYGEDDNEETYLAGDDDNDGELRLINRLIMDLFASLRARSIVDYGEFGFEVEWIKLK